MTRRLHPIRAWELPETVAVASGQAAAVEAALDRALVRSVGALPVLLPLCEQLGLREAVNRHCWPEGAGPEDIDVGRMALVLILNRLQAPQPLVHVETWLAGTTLPEVLHVDAAQCNDDRLARTLDTLVPHLDAIWQDLVVAPITTFDLDLRYLCYDLTSMSFRGDDEEADLVRYGYSRDHRPDRKQIELAATVTATGGVPVDYRALAGNVADRTTPVENLRRLQGLLAHLPPRDPTTPCVVVNDRAMRTDAAQMLERSKQRDVPEKRFALVKGPPAVRPVYVHKEERVLGLVFCTMVALLLFALLELVTRRAGLTLSGQQVLAQCAALSVVVLVLHDGSTLRHLTGLAPPVATLLQALGWPTADQYCHPGTLL